MLQRLVRVEQLCTADGRSAGVGALPQQLSEPVGVAYLHVVVQQQQVVAGGILPAKIVDAGKVEPLFRVGDHPQAIVALLCFLIVGKRFRVGGVVLNDNDLKVVPAGLSPEAVQALFQIVNVVLVGDQDAHLRVAHDVPLHPVGTGEQPILHGAGAAGAGQMICQRLFGRRRHIGLGLRTAGGRPRVHPPVVQHLRHMGRAAGALQQPQEQVVVLAAVALRAFAAHSIPQGFFEHGQMADVVAAQQVIRRIVRLEVGRDRPPDALAEQGFVAVQKAVRLAMLPQLQNCLAHSVQGVGCQNVVVVGQRQILPRGQLRSGVGVGRNALVFDLFVYDSLILCLIFLHDALHITVLRVRSIGQAELPVGRGLPYEGIQKFPQVFFRGIIQRSQDRNSGQAAGVGRLSGHLCALGFQHLFCGQVAGLFAKTAAFDKARAPLEHGRQALVLGQLHGISSQLSGTFQSQVHTHASPRWVAL